VATRARLVAGLAFAGQLALVPPVFASASLWLFGPKDWPSTIALIREKYPEVKQIQTAELAAWLADAQAGRKRAPLLIDTRTAAEYKQGRIAGSVRAETEAEARALLANVEPGREVVLYCAVGYRSSALASRLQKAGAKNLANLEGSLFAWANEGRAIVDDAGAVSKVHPYDSRWGRLVKPEHRATVQ
jgi:rhodanese-related sulfurtransferase